MEISGFVLGDPKQLVRSIWNLDKLEEDYSSLKTKIDHFNQLIENESDRVKKNEANKVKDSKNRIYLNELLKKKREAMGNNLEFAVNFKYNNDF